jgi:hypothetical protein
MPKTHYVRKANILCTNCYYYIRDLFYSSIRCKSVLIIKEDSLVRNIQDQFNAQFPFLKIEFLKIFANTRAECKTKYAKPDDLFKRIPGFIDEGKIDIYEAQTVARVESNFKECLGVSAHVFRRSGDIWIETTLTEDWTLEQQNKIGEQITNYREAKIFLVGQMS